MSSMSLFKALVAIDCINVTYVFRTLAPYVFPIFNSYRTGQYQYICILRKQKWETALCGLSAVDIHLSVQHTQAGGCPFPCTLPSCNPERRF